MKQHSFQLIVIIGGFGEAFVKKERFDNLVEGVGTMAALMVLSRRYY